MKITIIGSGAAFSNKNYNQCFMLDDQDIAGAEQRMLVDCGYQVGAALYKAKVDLKSITEVYVSHAHADHAGFLEGLAFQRYDWAHKPHKSQGPILIGNSKLIPDLWEHTLSGGLKSIEGLDATLETFFKVMPIESNDTFRWAGWDCHLVQQIHIMTGSSIANTFGLFMTRKSDGYKVYFTTDSQHCSPRQVEIFYEEADVIFQDCEVIGVRANKRESVFMSGVHANYAQLAGWESANSVKLSKSIKKKMWLCHYQDMVSDNVDQFGTPCDWELMAKEDGFRGFVRVGQEIVL